MTNTFMTAAFRGGGGARLSFSLFCFHAVRHPSRSRKKFGDPALTRTEQRADSHKLPIEKQ
jgi:hypothetical protein